MSNATRKWECIVCGWIYDEAVGAPDEGVPAGTRWEDVPEDFLCPDCGVGKEDFELMEDESQPAPPLAAAAADQAPMVIIGTGLAGYNLAKEFRKHDSASPLVMITSDDGSFYSKPMLSTGFTRDTDAAGLATASAEEMAGQLGAEILTFTEVTAIDTEARRVDTDKGRQLNYAKLVLAWGAQVIEPPLAGEAMDLVYTVNSLMDYAAFRKTLDERKVKKLLIIGAGLIGSEFTNDLLNGGYRMEVVDPLGYNLPTLLPEEAGRAVQEALSEGGAVFHFGTVVERVDRDGEGLIATLANGEKIEADLALCAVGVRPRLALAEQSGLKVNRGVVVDRYLRTSAEDVYALGDCAEVEGLVLFYVAPLMAGARALAKTLSGETTKVVYPAMPVTIKTPACPVVVSPPPPQAEGEWRVERDGRDVVAEFRDGDGRLLGFALTGGGASEKLRLQGELPPLLP